MKHFDYIEEANRTMSSNFHDGVPASLVATGLSQISREINSLDAVKKKMFYGRPHMGLETAIMMASASGLDCTGIDFAKLVPGKSQEDAIRIFHGIIGAITEAGELAFALAEAIDKGTPLDLVNVAEEFGDNQWYIAAGLRAMGRTFDDIHRQNIDKLRLRFPDKFTEHDANNRDLDAERKLLERKPFVQEHEYSKSVDLATGKVSDLPAAGVLAGPQKPVVRIKDWAIVENILFGTALDHPRAPGGGESDIRSSRIIREDRAKGEIETQNTIYKLL